MLTRTDAISDFIAPYNLGADGLVIWGDAGGNPKALSCMCDPQHNGPSNPTYFENIKQQTGPLVQEYAAKVAQCSTTHCSGHGRCDKVPETPSEHDGVASAPTCACYEGFSGPTCATGGASALKTEDKPALAPSVSEARSLFSADFAQPLALDYEADLLDSSGTRRVKLPSQPWVLESQNNRSLAQTRGGSLVMENRGSHMVLWLNRRFPAQMELRFGVMPRNSSVGLAIVFFSTMPVADSKYSNETSIFGLSLPPRTGDYPKYHSGALQGYSGSYWRAGNGTCQLNPRTGHCCANLRKNPGFHLVKQGDDLIIHKQPKNGLAFEVVVRREGVSDMSLSVDGTEELRWSDTGPGAPLRGGFIGLRQMAMTTAATYTHFDVDTVGPSFKTP